MQINADLHLFILISEIIPKRALTPSNSCHQNPRDRQEERLKTRRQSHSQASQNNHNSWNQNNCCVKEFDYY